MYKIALLVLYNHRYDKNIPIIEKIYESKFSYLYHIIPFYEGGKDNVLPVYESSYQFQSYIAQAYQQIKHLGFTHYFVVADDMIINPQINENNLFEFTGIPEDSCYIAEFIELFVKNNIWAHQPFNYNIHKRGVEITNVLPNFTEAEQLIQRHNIITKRKISYSCIIKYLFWFFIHQYGNRFLRTFLTLFKNKKVKYPLVGGYSDILILTESIMTKFCTFCGAFAATELFAEIAIPTALTLSTDKILCGKQLKYKYIDHLDLLKNSVQKDFDSKYHSDLQNLLENYPQDMFFIHPIKLSKWKTNKI